MTIAATLPVRHNETIPRKSSAPTISGEFNGVNQTSLGFARQMPNTSIPSETSRCRTSRATGLMGNDSARRYMPSSGRRKIITAAIADDHRTRQTEATRYLQQHSRASPAGTTHIT